MPSDHKYSMGDVMYDFTVTTVDGNEFKLSEVLKEKKAVLLNFWYINCPWCVVEFPYMQEAYEEYQDDIAILALDPTYYTTDSLDDIKQFKSEKGLTFDIAEDSHKLTDAFDVMGFPTSIVIDRYGAVCMIEDGAITNPRIFELIFDHFTAADYEQRLIYGCYELINIEKPNVAMPDSEELSDAFDKGAIEGITYLPYLESADDEEKEYSWPFVISEYNGETVIKSSNAFKEASYAQIIINVPLRAGEAICFDYLTSTSLDVDYFYVDINGSTRYSLSGVNTEWKTCYAYAAEEDEICQIGLIYYKDFGLGDGDDTVYLKNLRVISQDEIDEVLYIPRQASTNPDEFGKYQNYVDIVYNENDGYYHVGKADGPILFAYLLGATHLNAERNAYDLSYGKDYEEKMTQYCILAYDYSDRGICPVTEELKALLWRLVEDYGDTNNPNDWLRLCIYYNSYGTNEEFPDPTGGLAANPT